VYVVLGLAHNLLSIPEASLDICTLKLKALCKDDLAEAARTEKAGPLLFSISFQL
jgi:hypothetical protein